MTTRATNERPTRRLMGDLVVELSAGVVTIRPVRTRKGGPAEIAVTPRRVYEAALLKRVKPLVRAHARG